MSRNNILVFIVVFLVMAFVFMAYKSQGLKRVYNAEVENALAGDTEKSSILTEEDIRHLPSPVQKYLTYVGVVGKEKVRNFKVVFEGEFRTDPKKDWSRMKAVQYSEIRKPKRLYYMEMKMFGLPVVGLHKYADAKAIMLVKLAGMLTVVDGKGEIMDKGETVTVFNDMCMFAPGSLIDERIAWETIDPLTVKATFNNSGIKVSAILYFNDKGELVKFVSDDRYYSPTGKTYENIRWSTPSYEYKDYNGFKLSSGGEAVWAFPEGDYCYGKVNIKDINYNVAE